MLTIISQLVSSSFDLPPQREARDTRSRDDYRSGPERERRDDGGYRGPIASTPGGIEYANPADAASAFDKMLKRVGVQTDWTWERTLREIIRDPAFRSLKDPSSRKDAFVRYIDNLRIHDKEAEIERLAKFKVDFRNMLARHSEIKHYTRWKTALGYIQDEPSFASDNPESEKRRLFDEYVLELRKLDADKRTNDHQAAVNELQALLQKIVVSPNMRWAEANQQLNAMPEFAADLKFQTLTKTEVLDAFAVQIRHAWDQANDIAQRAKKQRARRARQTRDAYRDLLYDLSEADELTPQSSWQEIYPRIKDTAQLKALLKSCRSGDPKRDGSTPIDLFFDFLDDMEGQLHLLRKQIDKIIYMFNFRMGLTVSEDAFIEFVNQDRSMRSEKKSNIRAIYKDIYQEEVAREQRHQQRRAVDALRSHIKHLSPAVQLTDTWETVFLRIQDSKEYKAITADEDRRAAFDKHLARLKEDAERAQRHKEREERSSRRHRRSRSPARNGDAYEEDRRRAMEQRERQYRNASMGGAHSPPSAHGHRARDDMSKGSMSRYDRGRRERDLDREKPFMSRADPFSKPTNLDYGDESSDDGKDAQTQPEVVAKRERTASHGAGRERVKRVKTDEGKEAEPNGDVDMAENLALQSGSEEGEIEEVVQTPVVEMAATGDGDEQAKGENVVEN